MKDKHNSNLWNKIFLVYYIVLALLLFFAMQPFAPVNNMMRYIFYVAIFLPTYFRMNFFLPVFAFFMTVSGLSFTPVLPTHWGYSLVLVIAALFLSKKKKINFLFFSIPILFVLMDFAHGGVAAWSSWIFVMGLLGALICDEKDVKVVVISLMLVSVFMSMLYLVNYEAFEWIKHTSDDKYHSTSGWMNHNRFDSSLGCGALLAVAVLLNQFENMKKILPYKIIAIAAVVLTIIVMLKDVSRGSIVSLTGGVAVLILTAKTKPKVKVFTLVSMLVFVAFALTFTSADYLISKFEESNVSTAGNRLDIWNAKLSLFLSDNDIFKFLFGIGWGECLKLGVDISTHNDWITAFVAFGVVGLLVYLMIFFLLFYVSKRRNAIALSVLVFLFLESLVLEPFFRGNGIMVLLYIIAVKNADILRHKKSMKRVAVVKESEEEVNETKEDVQYEC